MTNSEAIEVLNMIETHGPLPTMAKAKSIEALEKQIPKKPIIDVCCLFTSYTCTVCRHEVEVSDYYCRCCGQKIRETTNN